MGTVSAEVYAASPVRVDGNSTYFSVGLLTYQNDPVCSGIIIKHGVFLTAKHCFDGRPAEGASLRNWAMNFPNTSSTGLTPKFVFGGKIKRIVMDGKANDLAYVLYDPKETLGKIQIDQTGFSLKIPEAGIAAEIVGFPSQEKASAGTPRVVSTGCQFTGTSGMVAATSTEPGYDGLLYGTNCRAFWGVSGGPVFVFNPTTGGAKTLVGVVTHTFSLLSDGSIDPDKIQLDQFGKYIEDTNISPLVQAERLSEVMTFDLDQIPNMDSVPVTPIGRFCGYGSFKNLMEQATTVVHFVHAQTNFQPTFWIDNNPGFAQSAIANMKAKNQEFLTSRVNEITLFPWAKMVFQDFDKFRQIEAGQLGITSDKKECDAMECTNYFDFTIQVNSDEATRLFERFGSDGARRDLWGIYGHEYGHFILDDFYVASHLYSSYADAHAKVDALKYHLTVDAVGMVLSSVNRNDFAQILRDAGRVTIMGQQRLGGDVADRLRCFDELP